MTFRTSSALIVQACYSFVSTYQTDEVRRLTFTKRVSRISFFASNLSTRFFSRCRFSKLILGTTSSPPPADFRWSLSRSCRFSSRSPSSVVRRVPISSESGFVESWSTFVVRGSKAPLLCV